MTKSSAFDRDKWESFLLKIRFQKSKLLKTTSYATILLNDPQFVYLVYTHKADVFSVPLVNREPSGTRQFLFSVDSKSLLFGIDWQQQSRGMVILQSPETQILRIERATLAEISTDASSTDLVMWQIDTWVESLTDLVIPKLAPKNTVSLDIEYKATEETVVQVRRAGAWIIQKSGNSYWPGHQTIQLSPGDPPFPLTRQAWLTMQDKSQVHVTWTFDLLQTGQMWTALNAFSHVVINQLTEHVAAETANEQQQFLQRLASETEQLQSAVSHIAQTLNPVEAPVFAAHSREDALLDACTLVARAVGIDFEIPATLTNSLTLRTITEIARINTRQVALEGEWWKRDQGALLAFTAVNHQPVALLPLSKSCYELYNPVSGQHILVDETAAAELDNFATQFYPRLKSETPRVRDLLRLILAGERWDTRTLVLSSLMLGLIQISIPIAISILFDQIIPLGESANVGWIALWLILLVVATFVVQFTQRIAILRLSTHAEERLQAGIWGRLLSLKPIFFRGYSAGDLGNRVLGLSMLANELSETVLMGTLQCSFLLFNFLVMIAISPTLALLGLAYTVLAVLVITTLAQRNISYQREWMKITGINSGRLWEFINGIAKFRVAGAEIRVFSTWTKFFVQQRRMAFRLRSVQNTQMIFRSSYQLLSLIGLFWFAAQYHTLISVGTFAAFYVAFTQCLNAALDLSGAISSAIGLLPLYERVKPILIADPEINSGLTHPGELYGEIEVSHVSFRYHEGQSLILDDVSFSVKRGEFVAIVGASGSGKSTLMRLMLGFDKPETGVINYDQKDLVDLDIHAVRQQLGVVMQNAQLMPLDFFRNIVGTRTDLTIDDAWEAARLVGLEKDIKAMPMGMQTIVTEGGSTISGGQRQRLLIAAAIVSQPRIIFFDEATSALDNRTQKIVSDSLEQLSATRIVIAHRLSTIINADTIIVMEGGRIVQTGNYLSLVRQPGPFAEMARHQTAS